jgi:hypothetical protein
LAKFACMHNCPIIHMQEFSAVQLYFLSSLNHSPS